MGERHEGTESCRKLPMHTTLKNPERKQVGKVPRNSTQLYGLKGFDSFIPCFPSNVRSGRQKYWYFPAMQKHTEKTKTIKIP